MHQFPPAGRVGLAVACGASRCDVHFDSRLPISGIGIPPETRADLEPSARRRLEAHGMYGVTGPASPSATALARMGAPHGESEVDAQRVSIRRAFRVVELPRRPARRRSGRGVLIAMTTHDNRRILEGTLRTGRCSHGVERRRASPPPAVPGSHSISFCSMRSFPYGCVTFADACGPWRSPGPTI